jgi:hypothetical protein
MIFCIDIHLNLLDYLNFRSEREYIMRYVHDSSVTLFGRSFTSH